MLSELFRIPISVAGVPLFGLGVLLGVWLAGWAVYAAWLWRRPGGKQEAAAQLPVALVGALVLGGVPRVFPQGLPIRGYGVMLLLACLTGLGMAVHRARLRGLHPDTIYSLAMGMFVCGILGARAFFVIEYWETRFANEGFAKGVQKALFFTEGGLVVYGSLIGAAGFFLFFMRKQKLPVLAMADLLAPSLAIGLALGRIGCLLNGCCYGGVCERPWAITFPRSSSAEAKSPPFADQLEGGELHGFRWEADPESGVPTVTRVDPALGESPPLKPGDRIVSAGGKDLDSPARLAAALEVAFATGRPLALGLAGGQRVVLPAAPPRERSLPVHPTQVYSAVNAALLGWLLWQFYPHRRRDGEVVALMLTLYPISRFLLEIIRTDESPIFGTGLSISQNVSLVILLGVVGLWFYLFRQPRGCAPLAVAAG